MFNGCNFPTQNLYSEWGSIHARGSSETQNAFTKAVAHKDVNLEHVIINGKVRSEWGHVSASFSKLAEVTAHNNIELINSSAKELRSEWGSVILRQTDGTPRIVSHITALNKIIAKNSIVNDVTLHVYQDQTALLDLTNTRISEKIVIKINESIGKTIRISFGPFSWLFGKHKKISSENEPKHFSILIKGIAISENISFEGFNIDEITSQVTGDGILVTGRKK